MPDDDFKLSLNIEADLTRLDSTLQQAAAKVSSAGAKMQQSLFAGGVGGQGGGFTGVSGIASPAASGPGVTGTSVSFGGNANIQTQSAINAQLQQASNNRLGVAMVRNIAGGNGGGGFGLPSWGRFAAGIGGAAYAGMRTIDSINNEVSAFGSAKLAGRYRDTLGGAGYAEQQQAAADAESAVRRIPLLGWGWGAYKDFQRGTAYASGDYANSSSPASRAKGALTLRDLEYTNERGFLGGGYGGQLTALSQQAQQFQRDVIGNQGKMAPNDFRDFVRAGVSNLKRQYDETVFGQQQKLADINAATQQSQFRALGGNLFAQLSSVQQQFREPIARLTRQNDPRNRPELDALRQQQSAATLETVINGIQPSQEFTPGTVAAGPRVQGVFGQDQQVLQTLTHMDANIGASLMQAVVGRN